MIIVKTSNGDVFINEGECAYVEHSRKHKEVAIHFTEEGFHTIEKVESVTYMTESGKYVDEGSDIKKLKAWLEGRDTLVKMLREYVPLYSDLFYKAARRLPAAEGESLLNTARAQADEIEKRYAKEKEGLPRLNRGTH